jgi:hypothetical protein
LWGLWQLVAVVCAQRSVRGGLCGWLQVAEAVQVRVEEVDAHNVVPVWEASPKRETAARTIRPKIHKMLPEFLKVPPPARALMQCKQQQLL